MLGIIVLLVVSAGVYLLFFNQSGGGTGSGEDDDQVEKQFEPDDDQEDAGKVTFTLEDVTEAADGAGEMDYTVKNDEDTELELEFSTSMKYDFYITDADDDEVYRESDEKSYMQVKQSIKLDPGEEETFSLELPELDAGDYTLTVFLAAEGYADEEMSIDFTVD